MRAFFIILAFSIVFAGFSQTKPEHKKKFYKHDNGRLYVNKDIPLYLHISDSRDNDGEHHVLESESTPQYSAPFFLDTEGYNTIRTPSKVDPETRQVILPKSDVIFEIYCDGIAPESKINYKTAPAIERGGKLYLGKGLKIGLTAIDKMSGVEQTYYSINGQPYQKYTEPLDFKDEKDFLLTVYSVDNVGNDEQDKLLKFTPDYTAPKTTLEAKNDFEGAVLSPRTNIYLHSVDNASGVKQIFYSYDDDKNKIYENMISPGWIEEGEHILHYYSKDNVDNQEQEQKFKFFMDKSAPIVEYELVGDKHQGATNTYISARTKIKLKAEDNKAGVKEVYYSINGKKATLYTEPFLIDQKATSLNVRFYAIDNVLNSSINLANSGNPQLNLSIYKDNRAPDLAIIYKGPNIVVNKMLYLRKTSTISLYANDDLSGVKNLTYMLDTANYTYSKSFSVANEGKHKITYQATDNTGNKNEESLEFYIDNNGPQIGIQFGIGSIGEEELDGTKVDIYPPRTSLFITATDQLVGYDKIYYSLNEAPEKESKGIIKNMPEGTYDIKIRALDKLGNESKDEIKFIIRK